MKELAVKGGTAQIKAVNDFLRPLLVINDVSLHCTKQGQPAFANQTSF